MKGKVLVVVGRNPLKSGHRCNLEGRSGYRNPPRRRNPLKSGHRCNQRHINTN